MEITNHELKRMMAVVKPAIPRRSTLPIAEHVLMRAENGTLYLTATNIDMEITARGLVEGDLPAICIHPDRLHAALASGGDLVFSLKDGKAQIRTTSNRTRYSADTLPAADFPRFTQTGKYEQTIQLDALRDAIKRVLPYAADNDVRFYLNSVYLEHDPKTAITWVVATNGNWMARVAVLCDTAEAYHCIIPLPIANLIVNGGWLQARVHPTGRVMLLTDQAEAHAKLIDAQYPQWRRVIPDTPKQLVVSRDEFKTAVDALRGYASDNTYRGVKLRLNGDALELETHTKTAEQASSTLPASGDACEAGFNLDYLAAAIDSTTCDPLVFGWSNPQNGWRIDDGDALFVYMPMRI